jgi:hypothetical protein
MSSELPLETLGGQIKAHIAKGDQAIGKAEEHYKAAGIHLKEAKERVMHTRGLTWPAFLVKHCSLHRSRADELIAIAEGKKTLTEVRAGKAERQARSMERNRSAASGGRSSEKTEQKQPSEPESKLKTALAAFDALDGEEREQFLQARQLVAAVTLAHAA